MKLYKVLILLLLTTSCKEETITKKERIIPIDKLDGRIKYVGGFLAKDIVKTINNDANLDQFHKNEYLTPIASSMHRYYKYEFNKAHSMLKEICGEAKKPVLFEVVDEKVIKKMRYSLETSEKNIDSVYLQLDINVNRKLARFNYYVTTKDGKLSNKAIFPKIQLKY